MSDRLTNNGGIPPSDDHRPLPRQSKVHRIDENNLTDAEEQTTERLQRTVARKIDLHPRSNYDCYKMVNLGRLYEG